MNQEKLRKIEDLKAGVNSVDPRMSHGQAAILNAETTLLLGESIESLQKQIPVTISELRSTLRQISEKLIEENIKLSESNNKHTRAMFWLTIILAIAAVIQALSAFAQWKIAENAIEVQVEANRIDNIRFNYEKMRNDRIEQRDVDWRRVDLELLKIKE